MNKVDLDRLEEYKIAHFSDEVIDYYNDLLKHLGTCARYQLLGNLFAGIKITNMDSKIPAIMGKMGGHTYFSFSIEPEKLLKISYVLHRSEANRNMMPTYQRIIKKKRMVDVQRFISEGGYFPNSLIVSIDNDGKDLQFDRARPQVDDSISKIGILHLPAQYRSAFIIDGQHRLYGYSDTKYAASNSIPVVAFVNLDREEQIKLFMDINENQKAVSKSLRNTLYADLLWSSDDWNKQRQALRLNIAQTLGEDVTSPLYGRIIVGEDDKSNTRCITNEIVKKALDGTKFFSTFGKNNIIIKDGTFDSGTNKSTKENFYPFLLACLMYLKSNLNAEWSKGESDNGILTINTGIYAVIRVLSDIVDHLIQTENINPKLDKTQKLMSCMQYYLDPLIDFYKSITDEERSAIKKSYGGGATTKYWRILQKTISNSRPEFQPEGLLSWIQDHTSIYNNDSHRFIREIELKIKKEFEQRLFNKHGANWQVSGLPKTIYKRASEEANDYNYEKIANGEFEDQISMWDCVTIGECREISIYGKNWSELFETLLTRGEEQKLIGGKESKTEWLLKINTINNKASRASYSVLLSEYEFLKDVHSWIINEW